MTAAHWPVGAVAVTRNDAARDEMAIRIAAAEIARDVNA
jgi:hypothetical protein